VIQETDIFFNTNDFAEPFLVTPLNGSARTINGVWISENTPQSVGDVTVFNDNPRVEFPTSKSSDLVKKSSIKRKSTNETFYVIDPGVDMDGCTTKTLSRVQP
jgi:hypothetical protein